MTDIKDLKEYTNTKNRHKLMPYKKNIEYLLNNNASQVAIIKYLDEKENLPVTKPTLSKFIKRYIKKEPYKPPVKNEKNLSSNEEEKIKKEDDTPKSQKKSLYLLD